MSFAVPPPWDVTAPVRGSLVSVVTPTYRRPELLLRAVRSVRAQTHPRVQHIVVGDGCPELASVRGAVTELAPDTVVTNLDRRDDPPDNGSARIARVRNAGVQLAAGGLIAHLDDDNEWEPDHLESLVEAIARTPEAGLAISQRRLLTEDGQPYSLPYHPWSPDLATGARVWQEYARMGVYEAGSPVMRDRVSFAEEREITADTNELLVRREVHALLPFVVRFPPALVGEAGEDDIFCEQVYRCGFRIVASGRPTLRFYLGGRFTRTASEAAAQPAPVGGRG